MDLQSSCLWNVWGWNLWPLTTLVPRDREGTAASQSAVSLQFVDDDVSIHCDQRRSAVITEVHMNYLHSAFVQNRVDLKHKFDIPGDATTKTQRHSKVTEAIQPQYSQFSLHLLLQADSRSCQKLVSTTTCNKMQWNLPLFPLFPVTGRLLSYFYYCVTEPLPQLIHWIHTVVTAKSANTYYNLTQWQRILHLPPQDQQTSKLQYVIFKTCTKNIRGAFITKRSLKLNTK